MELYIKRKRGEPEYEEEIEDLGYQAREEARAKKALEEKYLQARMARPPLRALAIKGQEMREALRGGSKIEWEAIHERFVDLWQEARLVIWRAKHRKLGVRDYDPVLGKEVQTYIPDDRMVLDAIGAVKGILDSMIRLRKEMGGEETGIPRWAIERIEKALRDYPEAQHALLKELAAEYESQEQKD